MNAHRATRRMAHVAACVAILAVSARIAVPTPWVPLTLQPLAVLLIGLSLPPSEAVGSTAAYLALGLAGVPVFTRGGGPAYVLQPTFGYLLGFIAASATMALLAGRGQGLTPGRGFVLGLLGVSLIYAVGVAWMYLVLRFVLSVETFRGGRLTLWSVILAGALVPLPLDLVKAGVAAVVAPRLRRLLSVQGG